MRNRRTVNGQVYTLEQFGGVIFSRADNDEVQTIEDIRGKRVASVSITGLGSGQMQFQVLRQNGLHHLQDPKQLIFMRNQVNVVNGKTIAGCIVGPRLNYQTCAGVLEGLVDVGFVRTDQLERTIDRSTGELVDLSLLKIIGPIDNVQLTDGSLFPFVPSTPLYPEWNVASLPHVADAVNQQVQRSLLDLAEVSDYGGVLEETCSSLECGANQTDAACYEECVASVLPCETTTELVQTATIARQNGKFAGWRTTLSYMPVRNMQHGIDFLTDDGSGNFQCVRAADIVDAVVCPDGHFKREPEDIKSSCEQMGLECHGFQCLCSPCVRAYDVDFAPTSFSESGCPKFSVCGVVEQTKAIQFRAVDNKKRTNVTVEASVLDEFGTNSLPQIVSADDSSPFSYTFQYHAKDQPSGVVILEVTVDGEQISESPFRLEIVDRDCVEDTGVSLRVPDELGKCVCKSGTVSVGELSCIPTSVLLPSILVPLLIIATFMVRSYVRKKRRQAEAIWRIDPAELVFRTFMDALKALSSCSLKFSQRRIQLCWDGEHLVW